jgi:hypothetical protein
MPYERRPLQGTHPREKFWAIRRGSDPSVSGTRKKFERWRKRRNRAARLSRRINRRHHGAA